MRRWIPSGWVSGKFVRQSAVFCFSNSDGKRLEALSKSIEGQNFHAKLQTLSKQVAEKFPAGSKRRTAYERWIERMHTAREQRNQMVHGRWGIEARRHKVVNVVGLPSGTQQSIEYTLAELTAFNDELGALARELSRLREHWPIYRPGMIYS